MPRGIRMNLGITPEIFKAVPPVMITTVAAVGGLSLNNLIGAATLGYILLQAGYLVWKWRNERKDRRQAKHKQATQEHP